MLRIALGCLLAIQLLPLCAQNSDTNATPLSADPALATNAAPASAVAYDTAGCTIDKFTVHSPSMGRDIRAEVVLPPGYKDHPDKQYPILYAMHGVAAAYDCFNFRSTILSELKAKPMIVAYFDGDKSSFYLDAGVPQRWSRDANVSATAKSLFTTFFFDEYIPLLDKKYRINPRQRMLTGFSMGGYGAFHYMLLHPEMFCSVSSMSGAFSDMTQLDDKTRIWWERLYGPMGDHAADYQAADVYAQVKADAAKGVKFPPIRLRCGSEDKLVEASRKMRDLLNSLNIPCEYEESPGKHDWVFWKAAMTDDLDFHWRSLGLK